MKTKIVALLLAVGSQAFAATSAEPLPSREFMGNVGMFAAVLGVLGFIGLLTASTRKVDLHYGMGDVYLSVPIALAGWLGVASLAIMGWRGDDLLPFMQEKLWLSGGSLVLALLLSFVLVRRCNPESGVFGVTFAAFGRLFVDTLSQLFSILVVLSGVWVIFGGRKQNGEKVSLLGRLGCAFAFAGLFNLVWGSIRTTTKEPVSSANGYLLGILNVLCMAAAGYAGYLYTHRVPELPSTALVDAVKAQDVELSRRIIAENPMLERRLAIEYAVHNDYRKLLNVIVRDSIDLEQAMQCADVNAREATLRFLKEKEYLSSPRPPVSEKL
ncbi:MAG: hypothetical protein IJB33_08665 [Akkermansia sp.]|nr:hypothetical protein [Akkermansia sp.]